MIPNSTDDADVCSCERCQHSSPDTSFGFRNAAIAEEVTRQLARCQAKPYWLIKSHTGIWYYAQVPHLAGYLPRKAAAGFEDIMARSLQLDTVKWLSYLGCEVVKVFNVRGDEVLM